MPGASWPAQGAVVADPDDARVLVDRLTDGRGADAVIDAIGGARGLDTGYALVRRRGVVVSVGVHTDPGWKLPVARAFADELTLAFAIGDLLRDAGTLLGAGALRCGRPDGRGVRDRAARRRPGRVCTHGTATYAQNADRGLDGDGGGR